MSHQRPHALLERASAHGIALVVVLVLLTVISLVSGATLRASLSAEQITLNVRLENLAREAAHIGLRHCEDALLQITPAFTVHPAHHRPKWHGGHCGPAGMAATSWPTPCLPPP